MSDEEEVSMKCWSVGCWAGGVRDEFDTLRREVSSSMSGL